MQLSSVTIDSNWVTIQKAHIYIPSFKMVELKRKNEEKYKARNKNEMDVCFSVADRDLSRMKIVLKRENP